MNSFMLKIFKVTVIWVILTMPLFAEYNREEKQEYDFAYTLFLNDNFTMAENMFKYFSAEFPKSNLLGNADFIKSETLYNVGRFREALKSYLSIIEKHPKTKNKYKKELYYRMAECYFRLKDYENAIKYCDLVLINYPKSYIVKDALLLSGESLYLAERYDEAVAMLLKLEKYTEYEYFDYVYYILGRVYYEKALASGYDAAKESSENSKESIKYFDRIRIAFSKSKILNHSEFRRANVYYLIGDYKKAISIIDKIKKREKDEKFRVLMQYFAAWNYYMIEDYDKALTEYDSIISNHPKDLLVMWSEYKKGLCLEGLKKNTEAVAQFKKVAVEYPRTIPSAYSKYAIAYNTYKNNELYESIRMFENVIKEYNIEELSRASHFMIGDIYTKLTKYFKAKAVYEVIERDFPQDKYTAKYLQAWCLYKEREYTKSNEILNNIIDDENAPADTRAKSILKAGDNYFELDMHTEAEKKYDMVVKEYKNNTNLVAEALYAKGWIYYKEDNQKKAEKFFYAVMRNAPTKAMRLRAEFMVANTMYGSAEFGGALKKYLSIMENKETPEDVKDEAVFYAGWCYYRLGKFDISIDFWNNYYSTTKSDIKKAEAMYRIGWAYFRQNKFDDSASSFDIIINRHKATHFYPEALLKKGDSMYNKKDYKAAIASYEVLVNSAPDHYRIPEALYGIQWSYYQLGDSEKAIELSKEFLKKYKGSSFAPEIQYRVAEHYYNAGSYQATIDEFQKFFSKNPTHDLADNALYWMGISAFKLRNYNHSITYFKTMLDKFPDNVFSDKAIFKIANAYYKLHEYENSIEYYKIYLEKYKESKSISDVYFNIAMSYKRLDKIEDSKAWYTKLIEEIPDSKMNERAHMNLAYLYQDNKEYDEALERFKKAVALKGKKSVEAQFWIGDIYYTKEEFDTAATEYMKVYLDYPGEELWAVSALDAAAKIYEKQGKLKKAISAYKKVKKATKQNKYILTAEKKIKLLEEQYKLLHPVDAPKGPVKKAPASGGKK